MARSGSSAWISKWMTRGMMSTFAIERLGFGSVEALAQRGDGVEQGLVDLHFPQLFEHALGQRLAILRSETALRSFAAHPHVQMLRLAGQEDQDGVRAQLL